MTSRRQLTTDMVDNMVDIGYHVTSNENYDGKEEKDERTARKYLW